MSNGDAENMQMATAIGEVQGMLKALVEQTQHSNNAIMQQMHSNNESINQRITDFATSMDKQTEAINRRIADHKEDNQQRFNGIEKRLNSQQEDLDLRKNDGKKAATTGGTAGIITAASIEFIKHYTGV